MGRRTTNPDFLTGVPELVVLRIVSRQPLHGYGIIKAIKVMSNGELGFGEGSIYPVLHRLEAAARRIASHMAIGCLGCGISAKGEHG